ncbi:MAG: argininosuccinate lyase, partial [Coriobacteriia bacterium]|nr:argininosuccinate lyase [Coriobacteriia bacterium]
AHEVVGKLVLGLEKEGRTLQDLSAEEYGTLDPAFGPDVLEVVDIDAAVARRTSAGGTAPSAVEAQLAIAREALEADIAWLDAITAD